MNLSSEMLAWGLGVGIPVVVAILMRVLPKAKLIAWAQVTGDKLGRALSVLMLVRLGRKAAESVEEGIVATLLATVQAFVDSFGKGLLHDNSDRAMRK